jgi:hypothetical protein
MTPEEKQKYVITDPSLNVITDPSLNVITDPSLNVITDPSLNDKIVISDSLEEKIENILIQSIKATGVSLTLYPNPDFSGEPMIIEPINNKINIACLEKLMRSAIITTL